MVAWGKGDCVLLFFLRFLFSSFLLFLSSFTSLFLSFFFFLPVQCPREYPLFCTMQAGHPRVEVVRLRDPNKVGRESLGHGYFFSFFFFFFFFLEM